MHATLLGCFDVGLSIGLDDDAFAPGRVVTALDYDEVAVTNPLGQGTELDLLAQRSWLDLWCRAAAREVDREALELAPPGAPEDPAFRAGVRDRCAAAGTVAACTLVVHAVGSAQLWLRLADSLPSDEARAVLLCFEYAAYTQAVGEPLVDLAREHLLSAATAQGRRLARLTSRGRPEVGADVHGRVETSIFEFFTPVLTCDAAAEVAPVLELFGMQDPPVVDFALHGRLHYDWVACVLLPRAAYDPQSHGTDPHLQLGRIVTDIAVANELLLVHRALEGFLTRHVRALTTAYLAGARPSRTTRELNRLRAFVRAVTGMARFEAATFVEEDHRYFALFDRTARLEERRTRILELADGIHTIQSEEDKHREEQRRFTLNVLILVITCLTFVSVATDSYNFVAAGRQLIADQRQREQLVVLLLLGIVALAVALACAPAIGDVLYRVRRHRRARPW